MGTTALDKIGWGASGSLFHALARRSKSQGVCAPVPGVPVTSRQLDSAPQTTRREPREAWKREASSGATNSSIRTSSPTWTRRRREDPFVRRKRLPGVRGSAAPREPDFTLKGRSRHRTAPPGRLISTHRRPKSHKARPDEDPSALPPSPGVNELPVRAPPSGSLPAMAHKWGALAETLSTERCQRRRGGRGKQPPSASAPASSEPRPTAGASWYRDCAAYSESRVDRGRLQPSSPAPSPSEL
mmetsp:Transcript_126340/g.369138  ORF Transcript_126340/g.369138 Transcript_126340/m.369138 type:complete len:243 (-) Transcript_126340:104-832(-)